VACCTPANHLRREPQGRGRRVGSRQLSDERPEVRYGFDLNKIAATGELVARNPCEDPPQRCSLILPFLSLDLKTKNGDCADMALDLRQPPFRAGRFPPEVPYRVSTPRLRERQRMLGLGLRFRD
jgi:hypothetical protein